MLLLVVASVELVVVKVVLDVVDLLAVVELVVVGVELLVVVVCAELLVVVVCAELVVVKTEDEVVDGVDEELDVEEGALRTEYAATPATPTMTITIIAITRGAMPFLFCNMNRQPQSLSLFKHLKIIGTFSAP